MATLFIAFSWFLYGLLQFLLWLVLAILNFWVWSKGKAQGNLLMAIGSATAALAFFIVMVSTPSEFVVFWMPIIGTGIFVAGFYLTVKPMVAVHIEAMKKKASSIAKAATGDDAKPRQNPPV